MPSKKHRPEEIIGKLREAEVVLAQGATTAEACLSNGVQKGPPIGVEEGPPFRII